MTDTRVLLNRITAFRRRLEETTPLIPESIPLDDAGALKIAAARVVADPDRLSSSLRRLAGAGVPEGPPPVLTNRARTMLEEARDLVKQQKQLSNDPYLAAMMAEGPGEHADPLTVFHRKTVALTDAALRLVQAFPDAADTQIRLCDGVDAMLAVVRDRLDGFSRALKARKSMLSRIDRLAKLLTDLNAGRMVPLASFAEIADVVLDEARQAMPIRFLAIDPLSDRGSLSGDHLPPPARCIAAHALCVAAVATRMAAHDFEFASRPHLPVIAALIMDVGMLRVPATVLSQRTDLDIADRRAIESHPRVSAEIVSTYLSEAAPLAEAIATHHERLDGTGYPRGLRKEDIPSLGRLLAVADCYAAMASDRPHRLAHDPRSAMTDVLLDADKGRLDRDFTEYLVHLCFHPTGSVIELTDGRIGVVIANHGGRMNLRATARPVVAILTDRHGHVLPRPEHVDLAAAERGSIVRTLPTTERRKLLAEWYPDLCD